MPSGVYNNGSYASLLVLQHQMFSTDHRNISLASSSRLSHKAVTTAHVKIEVVPKAFDNKSIDIGL